MAKKTQAINTKPEAAEDPASATKGPSDTPTSPPKAATPTTPPGAGAGDVATPAYDLTLHADVVRLFRDGDEQIQRTEVAKHVTSILGKHGLGAYTPILLIDNVDLISQFHANRIYSTASGAKKAADIFLIP
jgi:hypothetical protein